MDRRALSFAAWVLLGSVLVQVAWVLAVPPFRGIDEFDHAYRAASVADGQWLPSGVPAPDGRGELVRVPAALVTDAQSECSELPYTGPDNCTPVSDLGEGSVTVASAASRYNPVYYWLVGTVAQPFEGAAAVYAMRLASALLCSLLVAAAAWATARTARTIWPGVALVAAMTPVTLYSTAVAAPNGTELCAALALWATLLGITRVPPASRGRFVVLAGAVALPLTGVRGLGPLWLACILASWVTLVGVRAAWALARERPALNGAVAALVVAATAAATAWTMAVGSLELEQPSSRYPDPVTSTLASLPVWFLQSIAAFPNRNDPAHPVVYAAAGIVITALLVLGAVRSERRLRRALLLTLGLALLVPVALQAGTYATAGPIWQGRYGWPLSMGVLLLSGAALELRPPPGHRLLRPALGCGAALWVLAQTVSTGTVVAQELGRSPLAGDDRWVTADPWLVGTVTALGVLAWVVGVARAGAASHDGTGNEAGSAAPGAWLTPQPLLPA